MRSCWEGGSVSGSSVQPPWWGWVQPAGSVPGAKAAASSWKCFEVAIWGLFLVAGTQPGSHASKILLVSHFLGHRFTLLFDQYCER